MLTKIRKAIGMLFSMIAGAILLGVVIAAFMFGGIILAIGGLALLAVVVGFMIYELIFPSDDMNIHSQQDKR